MKQKVRSIFTRFSANGALFVHAICSINVCSRLFHHSNRHDRGGDHVRDDGDARRNRNHDLLHRCHDGDRHSNRFLGEYDRERFLLM